MQNLSKNKCDLFVQTFICVILYKYILLKKCVLVIDITYSKGEITMAIKVTSEIKPLKKVENLYVTLSNTL